MCLEKILLCISVQKTEGNAKLPTCFVVCIVILYLVVQCSKGPFLLPMLRAMCQGLENLEGKTKVTLCICSLEKKCVMCVAKLVS